jgi:hypothetical protein
MNDFNDDLDTPTEADLESFYGSKYLSAADVGDRKIRDRLAKIRKEELRQDGGKTRKKFVLYFDGIDKGMVLNATNKQTLVDALGTKPADWIGAQIGIFATPVQFAGKTVQGLRLRVLGKPGAAVAKPPAPKPPAPKPAAASTVPPWSSEEGDPGFNDSPDFA